MNLHAYVGSDFDTSYAIGAGDHRISKPIGVSSISHSSTTGTNRFEFDLDFLISNEYILKKPIKLVLSYEFNDDIEFIAYFPEAEITTSGDTAAEAIAWLASMVVDTYKVFSEQAHALGPLPRQQLKALEKYIAKKQD